MIFVVDFIYWRESSVLSEITGRMSRNRKRSKITHVGIPEVNVNQLTVAQLSTGNSLLTRVPNPYFGQIPRSASLGDPTIPVAQLLKLFPQFTIGNASRNRVRGSHYRNLDMALIKRVHFGEGRSFEFRAEVFNLTNTPPLGVPNTVVGSAGFGSITSAGDPRVIQLGAKLNF